MRKKRVKVRNRIGRNEQCPCNSGSKFKHCHGRLEQTIVRPEPQHFIDTGEEPIRWVISSSTGTAFFVDVNGRVLVFPTRAMATQIKQHELFAGHDPYEINVAGVGPTKWAHLQEILPFVEVTSAEEAAEMIFARIAAQQVSAEESSHGQQGSVEEEGGQESSQENETAQQAKADES